MRQIRPPASAVSEGSQALGAHTHWISRKGDFLSSRWLSRAGAAFPGRRLEPLCALSGAERELSFLLHWFDDAQQLSSVSSICGKQLVYSDCGILAVPVSLRRGAS